MPNFKTSYLGLGMAKIENFKRLKSSTGNGEVNYLRIRVEKMLFLAENILETAERGGYFS